VPIVDAQAKLVTHPFQYRVGVLVAAARHHRTPVPAGGKLTHAPGARAARADIRRRTQAPEGHTLPTAASRRYWAGSGPNLDLLA
jgi:hypothetical protein